MSLFLSAVSRSAKPGSELKGDAETLSKLSPSSMPDGQSDSMMEQRLAATLVMFLSSDCNQSEGQPSCAAICTYALGFELVSSLTARFESTLALDPRTRSNRTEAHQWRRGRCPPPTLSKLAALARFRYTSKAGTLVSRSTPCSSVTILW